MEKGKIIFPSYMAHIQRENGFPFFSEAWQADWSGPSAVGAKAARDVALHLDVARRDRDDVCCGTISQGLQPRLVAHPRAKARPIQRIRNDIVGRSPIESQLRHD